jgi:hypothetical protein
MTEKEERLARDRAEIAARVASFRETQQKFEREREEYYETTLANALNGSSRPSFWRWGGTAEACFAVIAKKRSGGTAKEFRQELCDSGNEADVSTFSFQVQQPCERWKHEKSRPHFRMWAGFFVYGADGLRPHVIASHAMGRVWSSDYAGTNTAFAEFISGERCVMPVWLEILINVMGYAGFIAIATYHRSPSNKLPDRWAPSRRASVCRRQLALCGPDEPVSLDQRMTAVGLRPQPKADDDEGEAKQQADHHDAPVSRFVRVVKRRDHGLFSWKPSLSQSRIRTTGFGF